MSSSKESTAPAANAKFHIGTWDDETRAHPAIKWMEQYTRDIIDGRQWDCEVEKFHTSDFALQKPSGEWVCGLTDAWKAVEQLFLPLAAQRHEPNFLVYWDYEEGKSWGMLAIADVFFRLQGLKGDAVTDKEGNKWDGSNSGAFLFHHVQEGDAIKLKSARIFSDAGPTMKLMLQNNVIDAETLKGIVIGS